MKTIAFYNNKGGVGKTTLAANVGYNLSTMGSVSYTHLTLPTKRIV